MKHLMPELPYAPTDLAPRMSQETLSFHYGKHLRTYLDNINRLVQGTPYEEMHLKDIIQKADGAIYNNAAQSWNHILFFRELTPGGKDMSSALTQRISAKWGSCEEFRKQFTAAATGLFGSGWVWLALDAKGELQLLSTPNAGNPMTSGMRPLMCIDVWEHAYYLDYQNRRADYVDAFWQLINWEYVEHRITLEDSSIYY